MHFENLEAWMAGDSMMAVIQQEGGRDGRSDGGNGTTEEELHTCKSGKGKVTIMEKDYIHVCYGFKLPYEPQLQPSQRAAARHACVSNHPMEPPMAHKHVIKKPP